jgi:hypothetical protein
VITPIGFGDKALKINPTVFDQTFSQKVCGQAFSEMACDQTFLKKFAIDHDCFLIQYEIQINKLSSTS